MHGTGGAVEVGATQGRAVRHLPKLELDAAEWRGNTNAIIANRASESRNGCSDASRSDIEATLLRRRLLRLPKKRAGSVSEARAGDGVKD